MAPRPRAAQYAAGVGQKSSTETLFKIVSAFIKHPTWKQADLARELETTTETVRKRLTELQAAGWRFEYEADHPHVYWSVPKGWVPGALAFNAEEAKDVLRLIGRSPKSALRDRVIRLAVSRLARADKAALFDPETVQPPGMTEDEERWLQFLEDAAREKVAVKMRYFTASRGKESWRHASVHRVDMGARPQFIATCHVASGLRRFRVANVLDARLDRSEPYRPATAVAIAKFDRASFGGYHDVGPLVRCAFWVRDPEAVWVAKNLPDGNIVAAPAPGGTRFSIETAAVSALARFVAGLGEIARPETDELKAEIRSIAAAALANTGPA